MIRYAALALVVLNTSPAAARTVAVAAGPDAQDRLQGALIDAKPGDVIQLGRGVFSLTDGLSLDVDRVTVRGAGAKLTTLDFKGQLGAGEGLLVTSDNVVLRDFGVADTKGDGIKSKGADRIVYKNIRVVWSGGPKEINGGYGIYPVSSRFVLIDGCEVSGASDAGIYVGQSEDIVVRRSVAHGNVAGIEIENSRRADVYENAVAHNTGGILVFDLPNLPKMNGGDVRVYRNAVTDNDQVNFAPKGNIVASVRKGTGVMVMANDHVLVADNALSGNGTANVMIISYRFPQADPNYDPLPHDVTVAGNAHGRAGFDPQLPGAAQLKAAFGGATPPIIWDGSGDKLNIVVVDKVSVMSLGLAPGADPETARPALVTLTGSPGPDPKPVVLSAAMLRAAR